MSKPIQGMMVCIMSMLVCVTNMVSCVARLKVSGDHLWLALVIAAVMVLIAGGWVALRNLWKN